MHRYIKNKLKSLEHTSPNFDSNTNRQIYLGTLSALRLLDKGEDVGTLIDFKEELAENRIKDDNHLIRVIASLNELYFIREKFIEGVK